MLMKAVKWPTKGFMNHIISAVARAVTFDQNSLSKHYYLAQWILSIGIWNLMRVKTSPAKSRPSHLQNIVNSGLNCGHESFISETTRFHFKVYNNPSPYIFLPQGQLNCIAWTRSAESLLIFSNLSSKYISQLCHMAHHSFSWIQLIKNQKILGHMHLELNYDSFM